jgi:hypothetical protein
MSDFRVNDPDSYPEHRFVTGAGDLDEFFEDESDVMDWDEFGEWLQAFPFDGKNIVRGTE